MHTVGGFVYGDKRSQQAPFVLQRAEPPLSPESQNKSSCKHGNAI